MIHSLLLWSPIIIWKELHKMLKKYRIIYNLGENLKNSWELWFVTESPKLISLFLPDELLHVLQIQLIYPLFFKLEEKSPFCTSSGWWF